MKMSRITLTQTLERIRKIRRILENHPEGLYNKDIAKLSETGRPQTSVLIHNFFNQKISINKMGKFRLFKLIDKTPSEKEIRLIKREKALKRVNELRKNGFSYSEITQILKKEFDMSPGGGDVKNIQISEMGLKRLEDKIREDRQKAGSIGGKTNVKTGHIFKIQKLSKEACSKKAMERIPKSSKRLTLPKVRIIAHCLFDGFVTDDTINSRYVLGYCNTSNGLIKQFINDVKKVYELDPTDIVERLSSSSNGKTVYTVRYCCKAAVKDLVKYTSFKKSKEKIPRTIRDSLNREFQIQFLRCFWDDEGMVGFSKTKDKKGYTHTNRSIVAFQKNITILKQIKKLKEKLGINSRISRNKIRISNKKNLMKFASIINFSNHAMICRTIARNYGMKKRDLLKLAINSYNEK